MRTIKLTGDFTRGKILHDLFQEVEDAKVALECAEGDYGHGSEEWHEAKRALDAAIAAHAAHRDGRKSTEVAP